MRDITINDILKMIIAHIKLVVIVSVVVSLGAYVYADNFIPKKYSASSMICIKYDNSATEGQNGSSGDIRVSSSSINPSTTLADNCAVIFSYSEEMRDIIPAGYSVSITPVQESNVLSITIKGSDAQTCADTANEVRNAAPEVFKKYYSGGEAVPFGYAASAPGSHSSPDETRYALLGFIGGLIVSVLIAIIIEIVDTTIKSSDDLFKMYSVPVFAEIIDFDSDSSAKKKGGARR